MAYKPGPLPMDTILPLGIDGNFGSAKSIFWGSHSGPPAVRGSGEATADESAFGGSNFKSADEPALTIVSSICRRR